ncbi:phage head closure protein [Bacillus smithii]|uniref:phage head closure protein n=1 Tax=Bacillus smithii TaxID=1479 RepID=UPI0030C9A158
MNPSRLRHRITFQEFIETTNENGFPVEDWTDFKTVWAMIKTDSNTKYREYYEAASEHSEKIVRFIVRYTTGIDAKMRILHKGRTFNIIAVVNDDELNKTLTIICKEVV